jgi:predicted nucleic acid-binding protein
MPVVSNTSPILNLAIIGRLDLLRQQFSFAQIELPRPFIQRLIRLRQLM